MWASDNNGKKLNKPIDNFNHAIDAMRYICMDKLGHRATGTKTTISSYNKKRR